MNAHLSATDLSAASAAASGDYRYGLATPAEVAGLSGKEVLQAIVDGRIPQAPISQAMTFWIVEVGDGFAAFEGEPGRHVLNPRGTVHGGWALTLIDSATGCACYSLMPPDSGYATVETKGNLSRPILHNTGRIRAEARVVSQGKQVVTAEARVFTKNDGKLFAHGTSTMMVLQQQMAKG